METNYIYKITNKVNGKVYIGKTNVPYKRWQQHRNESKTNERYLYKSMRKYGLENFSFEIIEECGENWEEREIFYIKKYNSKKPNGYNMTDGGDNPPTYWGFDNPGASINFKILKEIIADMKTGKLTREQLADKYKISSNTIKRIASGQTFRLEDETYPIRSTLLEQETVEEIKWYLYNTDIPGTELGFKFGLNRGNIKDINIGKSHKVGNTYPIRQRYISRNTYLNILMALEEGFSVKEIAKQTKASRAAILKIQANRNYYYNY